MLIRLPLLPNYVRWSIVASLALGIFYASVTSDLPNPAEIPSDVRYATFEIDRWGHFVPWHFAAYSMLAYALAYATDDWQVHRWHAAVFVIGSTSLYGFGLELVQYFIPERTFAVDDIVANALGALCVLPWYLTRPFVELEPIAER